MKAKGFGKRSAKMIFYTIKYEKLMSPQQNKNEGKKAQLSTICIIHVCARTQRVNW